MSLIVFSHANSFPAATRTTAATCSVSTAPSKPRSTTPSPHLDRLLRSHPLCCTVAFIGGRASQEMQQVGMAMTQQVTEGRIMMLDGSHLFPMERPLATSAAIEAALRGFDLGAD